MKKLFLISLISVSSQILSSESSILKEFSILADNKKIFSIRGTEKDFTHSIDSITAQLEIVKIEMIIQDNEQLIQEAKEINEKTREILKKLTKIRKNFYKTIRQS